MGVGWKRKAVEEAEGIKSADEDSEELEGRLVELTAEEDSEELEGRFVELTASTRPLSPETPSDGAPGATVEEEEGTDAADTKTARWRASEIRESSLCAFAWLGASLPSFGVGEQSTPTNSGTGVGKLSVRV